MFGMTTVVGPFKVRTALAGLSGLECAAAHDAQGQSVWLFTSADPSAPASERMYRAAMACRGDGPWLKVLDCGKEGGRAWVVTAPHSGSSLAELLRSRGALDGPEMVRAVKPVCQALQRLSDSGHQAALAPDLVLTSPEGDGTLIGFSPVPSAGVVPALGRLMFEVLKGSPPGEPLEEMIGVRKPLADFVRACLEGRISSAASVGDQLRGVGKGETVDLGRLVRTPSGEHAQPVSATPAIADALHDTRPSGERVPVVSEGGKRAGQVLGSYQLMHQLGEGGMGEVYLARHLKLGREVAVKVLREEFAKDPEVVRRFFQEARVVNEINHPHIIEVIDFVEELGAAYCVMELLKGETLCDALRRQGVPSVARACDIVAQVCEALHAAHLRGVVHRDVKPENIFLTARGGQSDFVKVLDFGVARVAKTEGTRTQVGAVLGTPAYMSPEQAQGRAVDGRTDIYSVGAVLYEALAGRVLSQELFRPPPLVDTARGEPVPEALAELVQQCLEMDPLRRPVDAREVAVKLRALSQPAAAESVVAPRPASRSVARWGLGAGVAAALAAAAVWAVNQTGSAEAPAMIPLPPPVSSPPVAEAAPVEPVLDSKPDPKPDPKPLAPAAAAKPKGRTRPPAAKSPGPMPAVATASGDALAEQYGARMRRLQKEYEGLVSRHGLNQLTAIEREVVRQALEDYAGKNDASLGRSLQDAESALGAARQRLDR